MITCFAWGLFCKWIETFEQALRNSYLRLPVYLARTPMECSLCLEKRDEFVHCVSCVNQWCSSCERLMCHTLDSCPYCRVALSEKSLAEYFVQ